MVPRLVVAPFLFGAVVVSGAVAQAPISRGALIVRLGADTIAVERFVRHRDRMEGWLLRRSPVTRLHHYVVSLAPDGRPVRFDDSLPRPSGTPAASALRSVSVRFGNDSATITLQRDSTQVRRVAAPRGFPSLPESFALYELWLAALARRTVDTLVNLVAPLGGPEGRLKLRRAGDTVLAQIIGGSLAIRIDDEGRLLDLDGGATTLKYRVERVREVDIERLAASFAARDSAGAGLGAWLSTRDTVVGAAGTARIWIDYGRPAKRGRQIFGRGVLGDTLWRTGANAATQFETSEPIEVGGKVLRAGRYSLWTHFGPAGVELIFNGQSGQWGTQYDPSRDVLRVPLRRSSAVQLIERFTISLDGAGGWTAMHLRWDTTVLTADIRRP